METTELAIRTDVDRSVRDDGSGWMEKVWCAPKSKLRTATLWIFGLQLTLNFLWSPVFFSWHRIGTGFVVIASLAGLLTAFVLLTWEIERVSALLFIPYLVWVTFNAAAQS